MLDISTHQELKKRRNAPSTCNHAAKPPSGGGAIGFSVRGSSGMFSGRVTSRSSLVEPSDISFASKGGPVGFSDRCASEVSTDGGIPRSSWVDPSDISFDDILKDLITTVMNSLSNSYGHIIYV